MADISFAPEDYVLEFLPGDTVPPITIPLTDENGTALNLTGYELTAEIIGPDGVPAEATIAKTAGAVIVSMTPAQSAQVQPDSQWCVTLATPDDSDVRTVILGRVKLIQK